MYIYILLLSDYVCNYVLWFNYHVKNIRNDVRHNHHYTIRACLVHTQKTKSWTRTKQTGMKSLERVFCSCWAVGNDHQWGYPFHHDRKAAMTKSTCVHHAVSTCHVWQSSSAEHHRVTVHSTVRNSNWRGYPSHHDSVQGQAKYDHLAVPMALQPSEQTEHKPEHPNTDERTHWQELSHLETPLEETANFHLFLPSEYWVECHYAACGRT